MTGLFAVNHGGLWYPGMQNVAGWFAELFKKTPVPEYRRDIRAHVADFTVEQIISLLPKELDPHAVFEFAFYIYRGIVEKIGFDNLKRSYSSEPNGHASAWSYYYGHAWNKMTVNRRELSIWRDLIRKLDLVDEDFARWFGYEYPLEMSVGVDPESGLSAEDIFRAHALKLLPREALYARFLREETAVPRMLSSLTRGGPSNERSSIAKLYEDYPEAGEIVRTMVERIVGIEEKRGELKTEVTYHAMAVERLYGSGHFVNLLAALGKENFFRGYDFSSGTEKRTVLSLLLKRCRPSGDDTPELLAERINRLNISEKRLAEAVMYCPQWAGLAEMAIGWDGLKSAVWFFHAHVNENYSAEKETEVALFSPITPEHFVDGAFDRDWFLDVHSRLGEQHFMTLYRSAKYINSGSNNHRRSQLYADAVLGKLDIGELEKEISDKRNQEKLRCYPLIPFAEGDGREALRRYEFIQKFAKESKQFGAQRRESEKKAVAIALENLAVATGLMDVNRLTWQMETRKTEELKPLMVPRAVGDVSVRLGIDEEGNASVICEKNGKILKTVPKQLAEDEGFLELKQSAKDLKEQKRRSRESLERAMTERAEFGREELRALLSNPVLSPMIRRLVWLSDGELGFLGLSGEDPVLIDHNGEVRPCGEKLLIAHPHDMITSGVWHDFMRMLYDRSMVQPFKQVFREYYPVTADEKAEKTVSRRYAGYQVNPKRALALLKGRGWTVNYEEGLQRVFYGQDLVAHLSALADWFSPADVEAPTLETVEFSTRRTGEPVALEDIPPILFSEVMRDIDLVVSVAYAGGVDPETSMSTIEIRRALAEELTRLLKLGNVRFLRSHAKIDGKLAGWSVHLGSGIVHADGKGMIPILPVHSQARGRVFLPFADDDPRTAEILSKIILLSEDTKIRDPSILDRL